MPRLFCAVFPLDSNMRTTTENFLSGFGALIAAEHDLRDQLRALIAAGHSEAIMSTLQQHVLQFETIIRLLEHRDQMLPHPQRFEALDVRTVSEMNPLRKLSRNLDDPIGHLVKIHQTLRHGIEALIKQSGHHDEDETSLREAAKQHREMECMLTALVLDETRKVHAPGVQIGNAASAWENEGGPSAGSAGQENGLPTSTILPL